MIVTVRFSVRTGSPPSPVAILSFMQVSWLRDHGVVRLPGWCQWLFRTSLPYYSGGTVRDFHPIPSWLPAGRTWTLFMCWFYHRYLML